VELIVSPPGHPVFSCSETREVVTVQVGGFANFMGAHFQVIPTSRPARSITRFFQNHLAPAALELDRRRLFSSPLIFCLGCLQDELLGLVRRPRRRPGVQERRAGETHSLTRCCRKMSSCSLLVVVSTCVTLPGFFRALPPTVPV
jgi:hypothetical protein